MYTLPVTLKEKQETQGMEFWHWFEYILSKPFGQLLDQAIQVPTKHDY